MDMKTSTSTALLALALLGGAGPSLAAPHDHDAHAVAPAEAPLTDGVIKKIDRASGKLTLSHGPLPNGMPAMTMAFKVKDASWLDKVKAGQKIRFASDNVNGAMTIVRLELPK